MIAQTTDISQSSNSNIIKKKRKFKIFDNQTSNKESLSSILSSNKPQQPFSTNKPQQPISTNKPQQPLNSINIPLQYQQNLLINTNKKANKQPIIHKTIQLLKMPSKSKLQQQFYDNDLDNDLNIEIMDINIDDCLYSKQGKFQKTTQNFFISTPSFLYKNDELILNQSSNLYQLLKDIKVSYNNVEDDVAQLTQSISNLSQSIRLYQTNKNENSAQLVQLQSMMEQLKTQKEYNSMKLKELEDRIQNSEIRRELEQNDIVLSINNKDRDINNKDRDINSNDKDKGRNKSKSQEELMMFVEQNGYQIQTNQQDQFAQSHILPAELITQFLQHRRKRIEQQNLIKQQQFKNKIIKNNLSSFHSIFSIGNHQYQQLIHYIYEQLPHTPNTTLQFKILFRRSVVDIQCQCVGDKQDLQYKQNLMFLIKTSTNKIIGGFISNCLVQEQTMEDPHAFLFQLGQTSCYKFKVKEECQHQAYMTNKFYLITFGTDLMISRNCLQEQSYCQWPSSYCAKDDQSNSYWLAGDFDFMIQHIQIFETVLMNKT